MLNGPKSKPEITSNGEPYLACPVGPHMWASRWRPRLFRGQPNVLTHGERKHLGINSKYSKLRGRR